MRIETLKVTPELAKAFLQTNTSNRKINKTQLEMIKRAMLAGKWKLTHQGIAFYSDGELADGQHRLTAIVETGVTCKMTVVYGVDKDTDSILAIDCGLTRTVVDSSKISGVQIKNKHATIARGLEFGFKTGNIRKKLSHHETLELVEKYWDAVEAAARLLPTNRAGISTAPVKTAVAQVWSDNRDKEALIKAFCETLYNGAYTDEVMLNAVKLRNKLLAKNYNGGADRIIAYNMTIHALSNALAGKKISRVFTGEIK